MSEESRLSHYVPRRLDDGAKFLFWSMDIAAIGLMGILVGVGTDLPYLGLALGILGAYWYGKLKSGKHPGIANHLLHWFTGFPEPRELPGSHLRELNG